MTPHGVSLPGIAAFSLFTYEERDLYISRQIREHGVWEPVESALVLALLKPGDVFLDLGANIGYYSVLASRACGPSGAVYAFEPGPENFRLLQRNLVLNKAGNVTAVNAAAAAATGQGPLFLSADNQGDHRTYDNEGRASSVAVPKFALDEWFSGRDRRIDLVKMDTQGSEAQIVEGMAGLIEENRSRMRMIIEFWPYGLQGAGDSAEALVRRLGRFGFTVHKVDESFAGPRPTTWEELLADAGTIYHPSTRHFTNLLLAPPA
jgi:FkbM family methyltransferase